MAEDRKIKISPTFRIHLINLRNEYLNENKRRQMSSLKDEYRNYTGVQEIETFKFIQYLNNKYIEKFETSEEREISENEFSKIRKKNIDKRPYRKRFTSLYDSVLVEFRKTYLNETKGRTEMSHLKEAYRDYRGVQEIEIEYFTRYCMRRFEEIETPEERDKSERRLKIDALDGIRKTYENLRSGRYNTQREIAEDLWEIIIRYE